MNYSVKLTKEAQQNYFEIEKYLLEFFGKQVRNHFKEKLEACLNLIGKNPYLFPFFYETENIRRAVIMPEVSIYYHIISDEEVHILAILNNKKERPGFES
jgi:plasmid stabilization system protein ParE